MRRGLSGGCACGLGLQGFLPGALAAQGLQTGGLLAQGFLLCGQLSLSGGSRGLGRCGACRLLALCFQTLRLQLRRLARGDAQGVLPCDFLAQHIQPLRFQCFEADHLLLCGLSCRFLLRQPLLQSGLGGGHTGGLGTLRSLLADCLCTQSLQARGFLCSYRLRCGGTGCLGAQCLLSCGIQPDLFLALCFLLR